MNSSVACMQDLQYLDASMSPANSHSIKTTLMCNITGPSSYESHCRGKQAGVGGGGRCLTSTVTHCLRCTLIQMIEMIVHQVCGVFRAISECNQRTAWERQDLSHTYLAHHELESDDIVVVVVLIVTTIIIIILTIVIAVIAIITLLILIIIVIIVIFVIIIDVIIISPVCACSRCPATAALRVP